MTTLIIHPSTIVQTQKALELAQKLLVRKFDLDSPPPDLHLISGINRSSIGIDDVKKLIKSMQYQPYEAPVQIGLILLSNMLTIEAQNSLLKTLEEPGEQAVYILTSPHERFLLPTIISRSKKIYIAEELKSERKTQSEIPDAEKFLDQDLVTKFLKLEDLIATDKDAPGTINDFLNEILSYLRAKLNNAIAEKNLTETEILRKKVKNVFKALHFISRNSNKKLTLENLILQLEESIM